MASLNEQTDVGVHEVHLHGDILSVREHRAPVSPALLNEAEDVIPAWQEVSISVACDPDGQLLTGRNSTLRSVS